MSLHGNFERAENGFEFPKEEFGEGKFHMVNTDGEIVIRDNGDAIASADLKEEVTAVEFALLEDLGSREEGGEFLEVVGGSDYLKDFLEKIIDEEPRPN